MGACCGKSAPYPAEIPEGSLPPGLEILDKNSPESIHRAIDVAARSFVGTPTAEPPSEFSWLLDDIPDRSDPAQHSERISRLSAMQAYCVHYAFTLGQRGLVMVARSGPEVAGITGVAVLYFYPKKWSSSIDGVCAPMKAGTAAGASKWTKTQNQFMNSKKMAALDTTMKKLHQTYASGPHIHLQCIGVDPASQGTGVGSKMMKAVSAIADSLKLPLYLECDPGKNEAVYKRCGYVTVGNGEVSVKGGKNTAVEIFPGGLCAMRREAGKQE